MGRELSHLRQFKSKPTSFSMARSTLSEIVVRLKLHL